jgi:hypothetical protein
MSRDGVFGQRTRSLRHRSPELLSKLLVIHLDLTFKSFAILVVQHAVDHLANAVDLLRKLALVLLPNGQRFAALGDGWQGHLSLGN